MDSVSSRGVFSIVAAVRRSPHSRRSTIIPNRRTLLFDRGGNWPPRSISKVPEAIAPLFYADWCGTCKALDPKIEEAREALAEEPVLCVTFDMTDEKTTRHTAMLANALQFGGAVPIRIDVEGNAPALLIFRSGANGPGLPGLPSGEYYAVGAVFKK